MADASEIAAQISRRAAETRARLGLSLQAVADRAGISKSHMWELEQGRATNPTIATAVAVARALGVSLDYLTGLTSAEPNLHPEALRIACEIDALLRRRQEPSDG